MAMSIAERTRDAVDQRPFLVEALRAGVVNYTAAARYLDIGETDAVAAALRRYAKELPAEPPTSGDVRLRMITGIGHSSADDDAVLTIGSSAFVPEDGDLTAVVAEGDITTSQAAAILSRLALDETAIDGMAADHERLILVTDRRAAPSVLRVVEQTVTEDSRD